MTKAIAEQSNRFSIFWLRGKCFLNKECSYQSGRISWSYNGEERSSINFSITKDNFGLQNEDAYIRLEYTSTDRWSGEKNAMNYQVKLVNTPCRYGGKRYWFICPLSKNGVYCGRRVGVLFSIGKWFGCRHCGNIAYSKQMEGGRFRWNGISIPDIERAEGEVKRLYYRGKPTRKYRRAMRLNEKFEQNYGMMLLGWKNKLDMLDDLNNK